MNMRHFGGLGLCGVGKEGRPPRAPVVPPPLLAYHPPYSQRLTRKCRGLEVALSPTRLSGDVYRYRGDAKSSGVNGLRWWRRNRCRQPWRETPRETFKSYGANDSGAVSQRSGFCARWSGVTLSRVKSRKRNGAETIGAVRGPSAPTQLFESALA